MSASNSIGHLWEHRGLRTLRARHGMLPMVVAAYLYSARPAEKALLGVYGLGIQYMAHDICATPQEVESSLRLLCEARLCAYVPELESVWVHDLPAQILGEALNPRDKRVKAVRKAYAALPDDYPFLGEIHTLYADVYGLGFRREPTDPYQYETWGGRNLAQPASGDVVALYHQLKQAMPTRAGLDPVEDARSALASLLAEGVDPEQILSGARRYRAHCDKNGVTGTSNAVTLTHFLSARFFTMDPYQTLAGRPFWSVAPMQAAGGNADRDAGDPASTDPGASNKAVQYG